MRRLQCKLANQIACSRHTRKYSASETGSSSESDLAIRLDTVNKLLASPKRHKYTAMECYRLYQNTSTTVVEDLLDTSDQDAHASVLAHYRKSKLLAAFILDQICTITKQGKYDRAISFLEKMESLQLLTKSGAEIVHSINLTENPQQSILTKLSSVLILENLRVGEPLLAAQCALALSGNGALIESSSIADIVVSLSVNAPQRRTYHSFTIMKLLETFKDAEIPLSVRMDAARSMLGGPVVPFFANLCYDQIAQNVGESDRQQFEKLTIDVIESNMECGHLKRCTDMWILAYQNNDQFAEDNMPFFAKLVEKVALKNKADAGKLVEDGFSDKWYEDSRVVSSLLAVFGQTVAGHENFEKLTHTLKPPLLRKSISLLFVSFLFQKNEIAAERILKAIFGTKNGLAWEEFLIIVQRLLNQHKISQVMTMCSNTDINVSKGGFVKAVEFLLFHSEENIRDKADISSEEYRQKKWEFLLLTVRKFRILAKDDPVLRILTLSIIRYLSHHVSNQTSRKFFIVFGYPDGVNKPYFNFLYFLVPQEFCDLVNIDESNQLACLEVIFNQAVVDNDKLTLLWSILEMEAIGLLRPEIERFYVTEEARAVLNAPEGEEKLV